MKPCYQSERVTIYHADCRDALKCFVPASVNCCVTSPPYWGLRDYGNAPSVWGGADDCPHRFGDSIDRRYDGGFGSESKRWNHQVNGRGENQDLTRDEPATVSQGAFCECGAWLGCLGLEPTPELYVEHIVEVFRRVRDVLRDDGTLWLNLGDSYANDTKWGGTSGNVNVTSRRGGFCRERKNSGLKPKDLVGIPWRVAFALQADGWYLRQDIIWHKPAPMPESVTDRCTKAHEYLFLLAKSQRYFYDAEAIKDPVSPNSHSRGGGVNRKAAMNATGSRQNASFSAAVKDIVDNRNKRSVWTVNTKPFPGAHFATFPPKLIEPCILAGCPEGGVVLDPFHGAGTTGMVAQANGRRYVGIELSEEYIQMSIPRLRQRVLF